MNSLFINISLFSLLAHHYAPSPIFSKLHSNLNFINIHIDRSFGSYSYNNQLITIKNSKFIRFIDTVINVVNDEYNLQFNGYFRSSINLHGLSGNIGIINSLFYKLSSSAIIYENYEDALISIVDSNFISISGDNAINIKSGASLFVGSSCFYSMTSIDIVLDISVFLKNTVQFNYSSFLSIKTTHSLIDCTNCSFYINNDNFTSNEQHSLYPLMRFNNMNYFTVNYLNLYNSISFGGIHFTNHIDHASFNMINVYNYRVGGTQNGYIFNMTRGSIYIFHSSFNVLSNLNIILVSESTAFFYNCNSSRQYNSVTLSRMIWTINCKESQVDLSTANPTFYRSLRYCEDNSLPNADDLQVIVYNGKEKEIKDQSKGATEILSILLFCALGISVIGLSLWLILYFVVCKNPLREFNDNDDQMANWKHKWDWIQVNSNKAVIEHKECSDIELDPIELSEDAINRRHKGVFEPIQTNSEGNQKTEKDNFEIFLNGQETNESESKKTGNAESKKIDDIKTKDVDGIESDLINDNSDKSKSSEKEESIKSKRYESVKNGKDMFSTLNLGKSMNFKKSFYKNPKKNQSQHSGKNKNTDTNKKKGKSGNTDTNNDEVSDLKSTRTNAHKIHSSSSDRNKLSKEEDINITPVISESGDLDDDNEKIRNDLEKTLDKWNRFQKSGIDKSLGVVDDSSGSSWEYIPKKTSAQKKKDKTPPSDSWSEDNGEDIVWSDDDDDGAKGDDEDESSFY